MTHSWKCSAVLILCVGAVGMLSGCAARSASAVGEESGPEALKLPEPVVEERVAEEDIVASSVPASPGFTEEDLPSEKVSEQILDPLFLLDIPFNFDQAGLREDAVTFVEVNAIRLQEEAVGKVLLEGRADEIGTFEYNLVLGDRRAHAVKRHLVRLGLRPSSFVTTSYGKAKPLCTDHNAECWQTNRSVRFETK